MKTIIKNIILTGNGILTISMLFSLFIIIGCEDFIDVDDPNGQILQQTVFEDEGTAEAAVTSLYGKLRDEVLLTGNSTGMSILMGFYSDDLEYFGSPGQPLENIYRHQIISSDENVAVLWNGVYNLIYMSNSAIEGIESSQNLSVEIKKQLTGEALFIRALSHFYLVNLFGDIPYITTTDYLVNKDVSRMSTDEVYSMIISDLLSAKSKLGTEYISGERVRVNRFVVSALLARVYLYMEEWAKAEAESSELINNSSMFHLENDVNSEFLKESASAILQLKPKNEGDNTKEAANLIFVSGPPIFAALPPDLIASFESGDLRRTNWVSEVTDGNQLWYAPFKYKQLENTGTSIEYSIVMRIAEQYLIRAEARVHLGNLPEAKQDINIIRNRAGLPDTTAISAADILETIMKERKHELFMEHGHRWFDLKRTGQANEALAPIKANWKSTDILLPIPEVELLMNPNLAPQNPGY